MAEKSFGVKEINLIGASGTPTIESPNNLNLNAVNVAISTNATIGGNLTVSGNVGIAGTLTYEDVTNVDAIGIVTAREGVFIPDNKELKIGNTAGSPDFSIKHDTSNTILDGNTGDVIIRADGDDLKLLAEDDIVLRDNDDSTNFIHCINGGKVILYHAGSQKFETNNTGAEVTGTCVATTFSGSGASLTNLPAGNLTGTLPAISGANLTNLPASTPADTDPQIVFDISASGSSGYIFTGPGNDGSTVNPDIYLMRGQRYRFINTTGSSHPFEFRNADNNADFTDGITGSQSGTQDFNVQYDAPAHLKYRCTIHTGSMVGNIYIRSGADTGAGAGTENIEIGGFLRFDNTVSKIVTDTSDGSDNKAILITGGGDTATTRGALAVLYGNELNSGRLDLYSGVGGGDITFNTGTTTTEKLRISSAGLTTLKNFNGTGLKLEGSGSDYQGMQLQVTDASASQTRNVFIDAVNETGAAVANQVGQIQSDGGSQWSWSTQAAGNRSDRREERLLIKSDGNVLIGTTTSAGRLTVDSGTSNTCATFQSSDAGAGINIKDNSARSSIEQNGTTLKISADTGAEHANSEIRLQVDGSTKTLIDSDGDIFIGTTTDIAPTNGTNLCVSDATISRLVLEKQSTIKFGFNVGNDFNIYDETNDASRFNIASDGAAKICHNGGAFGVGGDPINKFGITASDNNFFGLHRSNASTGTGEFNINIEADSQVTFSMDDEGAFSLGTSTDPSAQSGYSEKFRITSGGRFGFNQNSPNRTLHVQTNTSDGNIGLFAGENVKSGNNATMFFLSTIENSSSTYKFMQFNRDQDNNSQGVAAVFDVLTNGNVRNSNNSYSSISDVKLKENIIDASSQWDDIKNVRVRKFNFKSTPSETLIGVVAQEIETVSPGLVDDMPDMDLTKEGLEGTSTKSVKYSVLYMKAIKCLQEAQARIETLETKVTALEGS